MAALAAMAPAYGLRENQSLFDKLHAFETECLNIWYPRGCTEKKKEECKTRHGEFLKWACDNCKEKTPHSA